MRINRYGDKVLRKVSRKIRKGFPFMDYASGMLSVSEKHGTESISCPQIGELSRMFILNTGEEQLIFINPTIKYIGKRVSIIDTSLNIPGVEVDIQRYDKISLTYMDHFFKEKTKDFDGEEAFVIQKMIDHLDGILIIDYLSKEERILIEDKLYDKGKEEKSRYGLPSLTSIRPSLVSSASFEDMIDSVQITDNDYPDTDWLGDIEGGSSEIPIDL